ncbi:MAG: VanW family protein [Clostridiales bacterium]|nr:VanW family protein [Clostridiales bacterium]
MKTKVKNNKKGNISGIILILLLLLIGVLGYFGLSYVNLQLEKETIRDNVYVDNVYVGGLTKKQATNKVNEYNSGIYDNIPLNFTWGDYDKTFILADTSYTYDNEIAINNAYQLGRTGNKLKRIINYLIKSSPVYYSSITSYDFEKIIEIVGILKSDIERKLDESYINVYSDRVIVHIGQSEIKVIEQSLLDNIKEHILSLDSSFITIEHNEQFPFTVTSNRIYNLVHKKAINAIYTYNNNIVSVVKEKIGKTINKKYVDTLLTKYKDFTVVIEPVYPLLYASELYEELFKDELSTYKTTFSITSENNFNRSINISLAANEINGLVLAPGDAFSFNEVVGVRSEEKGYQVAHVYYNGEVIDGIGGGICQVSSTLYNTALEYNLDIIERSNHQFTVGYVPLGQDAAVSFGSQDFGFVNSTKWPLKIEVEVNDVRYDENNEDEVIKAQTITFKFIGTDKASDISYLYYHEIIEERPFVTEIEYDETKSDDYVEITQYGKLGYHIITFREIYQNEVKISEEKVADSYYRPYTQIEIHGGVTPLEEILSN